MSHPNRLVSLLAALSLGLSLSLAGVSAQAASLQLKSSAPDKYRDLGSSDEERQRMLGQLEAHLKSLSAKLPEKQALNIDLLDIDRAGETRVNARLAQDLRVMRAITWPSVDFRYVLTDAEGKVLKEGKAHVSDMNYLGSLASSRSNADPLRYEKHMLDRWFAEEFGIKP